jgi:hypothetical protein
MYAIVYIHKITNNKNPMAKKYIKKEKVLILKHDVILGSKYELVDVETDVTQYMGGGESMTYESTQVIPIEKPHRKGSSYTENELQELGSNNTFPIKINGHTIGEEIKTSGKNTGGTHKGNTKK